MTRFCSGVMALPIMTKPNEVQVFVDGVLVGVITEGSLRKSEVSYDEVTSQLEYLPGKTVPMSVSIERTLPQEQDVPPPGPDLGGKV